MGLNDYIYTTKSRKKIKQYVGNETKVIIPSNVEEIGKHCFFENNEIVSIVVPESVKDIKLEAFYKLGNLKHIEFKGENTTWRSAYPISYCPNIETIILPKGWPGSMDFVQYSDKLKKIVINEANPDVNLIAHILCFTEADIVNSFDVSQIYHTKDAVKNKDGTIIYRMKCDAIQDRYRIPEGVRSVSDSLYSQCYARVKSYFNQPYEDWERSTLEIPQSTEVDWKKLVSRYRTINKISIYDKDKMTDHFFIPSGSYNNSIRQNYLECVEMKGDKFEVDFSKYDSLFEQAIDFKRYSNEEVCAIALYRLRNKTRLDERMEKIYKDYYTKKKNTVIAAYIINDDYTSTEFAADLGFFTPRYIHLYIELAEYTKSINCSDYLKKYRDYKGWGV